VPLWLESRQEKTPPEFHCDRRDASTLSTRIRQWDPMFNSPAKIRPAVRTSQGSHGFPLRFNQLAGVRWRGRLLGSGRAVAELRTP